MDGPRLRTPTFIHFLAPSIGIGGGTWLFTFIIIMFAIHLLMPMRHGNHTHGLSDERLKEKQKKKINITRN